LSAGVSAWLWRANIIGVKVICDTYQSLMLEVYCAVQATTNCNYLSIDK